MRKVKCEMPGTGYVPNKKRAICAAEIVTVKNGRRIKRNYNSGEPLDGDLSHDDAPPFTGYVRDWFKKGKRS